MSKLEIFFDIFYLAFILVLGLNILLKNKPHKNILASMVLLLFFGDMFHLIPRIISNIQENGFVINKNLLLYGSKISALTMTIFYILLYEYIKRIVNFKKRFLDFTIYLFAISRLVLVVYNINKNVDISSNVPFIHLGVIITFLLLRYRKYFELKNLYIYVFFSFLFYIPVIFLKTKYPTIGLLMIPKTIAYILIALKLYNNTKDNDFNLLKFSFVYLIIGLFVGAFAREFSKILIFDRILFKVHTHILTLGFMITLIFYILYKDKVINKLTIKYFLIYNTGIFLAFTMMFLRGLINPFLTIIYIDHMIVAITGLGHILISISLVAIILQAINKHSL